MKCPKCQTVNSPDYRFCKGCATPLPADRGQASFTKTLDTTSDELPRGTVFAGRYEIIEELGAGGMGKVYRAYDRKIEEEVALKLIRAEIAADKRTVERFRNEIKTTRKITHKNVCRTHDLGEEGKALFITMEYVRGEDLKSVIRRMKVLAAGTAVSITRQVAEGLGEAHRLGVVHRDLKPGNIMIDKDGNAKIMDFGIARSLAGGGTTAEGAIIGTPEYMSPEQVEGKPADQRADIYALGVILFEMVTGRPPFEGKTPLAVAHKHKYEPAPDPHTLNPQLSADLSRLILRCLEKEREKRYQTTGELLADLEAVKPLLPTTEPASAGRSATKRKPGTSKTITVKITPKKFIIPAAVLIAIAAVVLIWMKFGSGSRQPSPDSIAVLPFQYRGEDKEYEYRADAMTDALTGKLVQVSGLQKVIARQSAMQYKSSTKKASEIARELGVKYLVEGSILQAKYQVQITVLLIDARADRNLWSYEFSGDAEDIVKLHNEIARTIVSKIKVKLTPQEETRLAKATPVDPMTYDSFVKALFHPTSQLSLEDTIRSAEENLKDIIRQDPGFVPPYVTLASVYWDSSGMNIVHPYVGFIKAREMAIKALELDETLGGAHAVLGSLKGILDYDYVGAQEEFNRALALSPNDASLFTMYCIFLNYEGRFEEALAAGRRSIELDPLAPIRRANLAWTYYRCGRQDDALGEFKKLTELDPYFVYAHLYLLRCYVAKYMRQESLAWVEKILTLPKANENAQIIATVGYAYGVMGEKNRAESYLDMLSQLAQKKFVDPSLIAMIYISLGEKSRALEWLEKAYEERCFLSTLKGDPVWEPLRQEPRFQAILKKIGLG